MSVCVWVLSDTSILGCVCVCVCVLGRAEGCVFCEGEHYGYSAGYWQTLVNLSPCWHTDYWSDPGTSAYSMATLQSC